MKLFFSLPKKWITNYLPIKAVKKSIEYFSQYHKNVLCNQKCPKNFFFEHLFHNLLLTFPPSFVNMHARRIDRTYFFRATARGNTLTINFQIGKERKKNFLIKKIGSLLEVGAACLWQGQCRIIKNYSKLKRQNFVYKHI